MTRVFLSQGFEITVDLSKIPQDGSVSAKVGLIPYQSSGPNMNSFDFTVRTIQPEYAELSYTHPGGSVGIQDGYKVNLEDTIRIIGNVVNPT
jgi:hypothetical protein